ncbi:MAG: LysM peptidoglycan-binding domain-containing protein [Chloroflexota bacterium]
MRRFLLISCVLALLLASFAPAFAQYDQPVPVMPFDQAAQAAQGSPLQQASFDQQAAFGQTIHIVERGETLASIARWYGVTVQAIASANGIYNPNLIYAGQRLFIPTGGYPPPPPPQQNYYIVRAGDTLASIARYFGTSIWAIAQANNISNPNWIYTGMYLIIPSGGTPNPPPPQTVIQYTVRPGDTLASIARAYGTTWTAIASYNGINNPNLIYWGMVLNIPVYNW